MVSEFVHLREIVDLNEAAKLNNLQQTEEPLNLDSYIPQRSFGLLIAGGGVTVYNTCRVVYENKR